MKHEWMIEWGDLVDEWLEREAEELHAQNQPEPGNEIMGALQINDDWLMAYVDHTDHDNEEEWEWIPTPNEWQMLEETNPLDCVTLPLLFTNYECELTYDQTSQRLFGQPPENLEDFFGNVQFYERCVEIEWNVGPTEYQLIEKNDPLDTFSLLHLFGHETRLSLNEINRQHQAMNMFGKECNSNPSKFIVPDTEPKPIVYISEEPENWESFQANPLDGYSLYGLFQEPEPVIEEEKADQELHNFVAFDESSRGPFENSYYPGHEEYATFDTNQFIQTPEGYEQENETGDMSPFDEVTLPLQNNLGQPKPDVAMLEHTLFDNFWDEDEVMDIQVGNGEVWTVNKAMMNDSFWMDSAIDGLSKRMEAIDINKRKAKENLEDIWIEDPDMKQKMEEIKKGKRKVGEDVWGSNQGLWNEIALNIDWIEYLDSNYLSSLFEEGPMSTVQDGAAVMMVGEEASEDFTSFIIFGSQGSKLVLGHFSQFGLHIQVTLCKGDFTEGLVATPDPDLSAWYVEQPENIQNHAYELSKPDLKAFSSFYPHQ
ncbi:hypothetical protein RHSIM_Rhsim10G0115100 [Rhododendron simsii]|uniref:Uncharacterized protein n=1 Tax=Rhododendron simsii TaxID=118357 RepID=A0A834GCK9_RHOSS|nr:hypothetical protein RHSIM_Rhsim10G0115100 [Rhododendron simsii]